MNSTYFRRVSAIVVMLAAIFFALHPAQAAQGFKEGCSVFMPCGPGLSCQPGVHVCYHSPRRYLEACSAGYGCGEDLQCAAGTHVCVGLRKLGESCDGLTKQCDHGLYCSRDKSPTQCIQENSEKQSGFDRTWVGHAHSEEIAADLTFGKNHWWNTQRACLPHEMMVGLTVTTNTFISEKGSDDKTRNFWTAIKDLHPICVATDRNFNWVGPATTFGPSTWGRDAVKPVHTVVREGEGSANLLCDGNQRIKRIYGTAGDYLYDIKIECTPGDVTKGPVGGFQTPEEDPDAYSLSCPGSTFVAHGIWFEMPEAGDSEKLPHDILMDCYKAETLIASAEIAIAGGVAPPASVPEGPTVSTKLSPEEVSCYDELSPTGLNNESKSVVCAGTVNGKKQADCYKAGISAGKVWYEAAQECSTTLAPIFSTPVAPKPPTTGLSGLTAEEQRCFESLEGRVAWDQAGSTNWDNFSKPALCKGASDADQRIACFQAGITAGKTWQIAAKECASGVVPAAVVAAPPASSGLPPEEQRCHDSLEGRVAWDQAGSMHWEESSKPILCKGATNADHRIACFQAGIAAGKDWQTAATQCASGVVPAAVVPTSPAATGLSGLTAEEQRCYESLEGRVAWDQAGSTNWDNASKPIVCKGTDNADQRIACFQSGITAGKTWQVAAAACTSGAVSAPPTAPKQCDAAMEETCKSTLQGQVAWVIHGQISEGTDPKLWQPENLDRLCSCTPDPGATVLCFQQELYDGGNYRRDWSQAIELCRAKP